MSEMVEQALQEGATALIEAGTGTGKTLAYLAPALQSGKKVVISTHTITLQEQLITKELPLLLDVLALDIQATLVKGMGNYVCLRKLTDALYERGSLSLDQQGELQEIGDWAQETDDGSKSDLDFLPTRGVWDRVAAEGDACPAGRCPHYKECSFFKARDKAADAQLLVVNHHLLLADLALKAEGESGILPDYDAVIIDEAHHLEEVATRVFASGSSRAELGHLLQKLDGRRTALFDRLMGVESSVQDLLLTGIPAQARRLGEQMGHTFEQLSRLATDEGAHRLQPGELPQEPTSDLQDALARMVSELRSLLNRCQELPDDVLEKTRSVRLDIEALSGRFERHRELFERLLAGPTGSEVHWVDSRARVEIALLDVSNLLQERLFTPGRSTILVGATLTTSGNFEFLKSRLGIQHALEAIFPSPFNFEEQALFLVSTHLPPPTDERFLDAACEHLIEALNATHGGAFVLFTSFTMLQRCYERVAPHLPHYSLLKHGDRDRASLLKEFREAGDGILFGTDSFWEGVDVVGDALRLVVIMRLPFRVPTEPILQARAEAIDASGGSSFFDYVVPQAIVKFKQGFGRLIRSDRDRGTVLCLDARLTRKSYGRQFLKSLPLEGVPFASPSELAEKLERSGVEPLTSTMPSLRSTN
jgi:ATP-dependent DNA helicase DinG